jgi:ubiquinone/menaquinone biosynthesis C-methylase UbiE
MESKNQVTEYYSKISTNYDRLRYGTDKSRIISELQITWFIDNLGTEPLTSIEIGCGTGRLTQVLASQQNSLVAIDGSSKMIKLNKKVIGETMYKNTVQYIVCDASHLPFRDESFSNVVGSRVFWHVLDYNRAFRESMRITKPNGQLLFDYPNLYGPLNFLSKALFMHHEVLTQFTTPKSIKNVFKTAGGVAIIGNTSMLLYLIPSMMANKRAISSFIKLFEKKGRSFIFSFFHAYILVKVTK